MSNNFTGHFSADDAALVLIDFQPRMFMGVESHDRNAIKNTKGADYAPRCLAS
jgi:hypothetical protein